MQLKTFEEFVNEDWEAWDVRERRATEVIKSIVKSISGVHFKESRVVNDEPMVRVTTGGEDYWISYNLEYDFLDITVGIDPMDYAERWIPSQVVGRSAEGIPIDKGQFEIFISDFFKNRSLWARQEKRY